MPQIRVHPADWSLIQRGRSLRIKSSFDIGPDAILVLSKRVPRGSVIFVNARGEEAVCEFTITSARKSWRRQLAEVLPLGVVAGVLVEPATQLAGLETPPFWLVLVAIAVGSFALSFLRGTHEARRAAASVREPTSPPDDQVKPAPPPAPPPRRPQHRSAAADRALAELDRRNGRRALLALFLAVDGFLIYAAVALLVFGLRHPEMTQTQVLLRIGEALLWR